MKVAVVGASPKQERYSNKALRLLRQKGHDVVPVNPGYDEIECLPVTPEVKTLPEGEIDTVTMYVGPGRSGRLASDLVELKPRRVIFNPGAENPELEELLRREGIEVREACTLVLLNTNQF